LRQFISTKFLRVIFASLINASIYSICSSFFLCLLESMTRIMCEIMKLLLLLKLLYKIDCILFNKLYKLKVIYCSFQMLYWVTIILVFDFRFFKNKTFEFSHFHLFESANNLSRQIHDKMYLFPLYNCVCYLCLKYNLHCDYICTSYSLFLVTLCTLDSHCFAQTYYYIIIIISINILIIIIIIRVKFDKIHVLY